MLQELGSKGVCFVDSLRVFWNFGPGRVWGNDEGLSPFVLVLTLIGAWSPAWSACFCKGMLPLASSTPLTNCESVRPKHTQRGNRRRVIEPYSNRLCVKITRVLKHRLPGPTPRLSGSGGLGGGWECAFLLSFQVTLMLRA